MLALQLQGSMDLLKDKEVDPKDVADLEQLITATEPLWTALGNAIAAIEADLAKSQPNAPQLDAAGPSRIMPPGATQVGHLATLLDRLWTKRWWIQQQLCHFQQSRCV